MTLYTTVADPSTGIPGDTKLVPAVTPFGYVRVSSIEQESGYGPEVQTKAIQAFCSRKDWPAPEIVHESVSGESLLDRVEIKDLVSRAKALQLEITQAREHAKDRPGSHTGTASSMYQATTGSHVAIVFYRLDRLARNLTDQEALVMQAMQSGFRLYSTQHAEEDVLDPTYMGDPARVMIRQIFGIFNQFERATIQARLDSGLLEKARTGGATGGRTPFGYMPVNQDIVVDPVAAPAVVRLYQLRAGGMGVTDIAAVIAREYGICSHWKAPHVTRALTRPDLYRHGLYRTRVGGVPVYRPELVIVPSSVGTRPLTEQSEKRLQRINWERVAPTVNLNWLALNTGLSIGEVQAIIKDRQMQVQWSKGRAYVGKADARDITELISNQTVAKVSS